MNTLALIFSLMSFFGVLGSILLVVMRGVQWSKSKITSKALIAAVVGYGCNGFLQLIAGVLYQLSKENENYFNWDMFWIALGISGFCAVAVCVASAIKN